MGANKLLVFLLVSALFSGCASQDKPIDDIRDQIEALPSTTLEATTSTVATTTTSTSTQASTTTSSMAATTISSTASTTSLASGEIRVEVVYFHPSQPCANCIRVGLLAQQTVSNYYSKEVASGKVSYRKINLADPQTRATVQKYGAASSSIYIGTYRGDYFHKEQKAGVWYKIDDEAEYARYLRETIDARLGGDLP